MNAEGHGVGQDTPFEAAVRSVIASLGPGDVMSYGEVAQEAGYSPRASRSVGGFLSRQDGSLPWWRVVTVAGRLVPGLEAEHTRLLRAEGVAVENGHVVAMSRASGRRRGGR